MITAVLLILLAPVFAATLRGVVPGLESIDSINTVFELRNIGTLDRDFRRISSNGTFAFYNLELDNKYRLSLVSDTLQLGWTYLVMVHTNTDIEVRKIPEGRPIDYSGPSAVRVDSDPLVVTDYTRPEIVAERETFSILKFFTQTTVWLSIGSLVLVTYLPSLLDNIDPDLMEELKKNQIQMNAPSQEFDLAKTIADRRVKK